MDQLINLINKFNTLENALLFTNNASTLIDYIDEKLDFLEPTPEFRKFMILDCISKNSKISQSQLAKQAKIVPAMINKYIVEFRKKQIIMVAGKNNKNIRYYLTQAGEELRKKYLAEFINEVLIIYKIIKEEIKKKMLTIHRYCENQKILLYGANEISELIMQCLDELRLNIIGIMDADVSKKSRALFFRMKFYPPEKLKSLHFDAVIITSLSKHKEIYKSIEHIIDNNKKIIVFAEI